jgi:RHS repeat-associated protein
MDGSPQHVDTSGSSRYSFPWDILTAEDGAHVLTVKATDTLGNPSSVSVNIEVALKLPGPPSITAPTSGTLTNRAESSVSGRSDKGTEVLLFHNAVQVGKAITVDSGGNFSTVLNLNEGENRIQAAARNRGGTGPRSGETIVTLDSTLPQSPQNLSAQSLSGGAVRLAWRAPAETAIKGYNLYRGQGPFNSLAGAIRVNGGLISGTSWEDLPPDDGTFVFRATTVDRAGNESDFSNAVSVVIDRTPPRAASIRYAPGGAFDPATGRMGQGLVNVRLTATEPLLTVPFLSITPHGGAPIAVELAKSSETEYAGAIAITDATPTGTAHAVFSARDLVGNRGTEIDSGGTLLIDASGPAISQITIQPVQPVKNDENAPVTLMVVFGLDEPVQPGTKPELTYLLSGQGRKPAAIQTIVAVESGPGQKESWQGSFVLPADAGLSEVEELRFVYRGVDDLGNAGTRILCENRFQIYQGDLPPLEPPRGVVGKAMPMGRVQLGWESVSGAADYQVYRKGPGETSLNVLRRTGNTLEIMDAPPSDGIYTYAVASVRKENGQEAVSAMSAEVNVNADSFAPNPPRSLVLDLISRGINARWQAPVDTTESVTYSLYRADLTEIASVEEFTPIIKGVKETTVLDPHPSASEHCYVVTAVDAAGNESLPSNSFYLNFGLLPVSSLKVVQSGDNTPVISWSPPSGSQPGTIAGYRIALEADGRTVNLNQGLIGGTSFTDTGFSGDERRYTVFAVDENGMESPGRSITLPVLRMSLKEGESLRRGVMNRLEYNVQSESCQEVRNVRLKAATGKHVGLSEEFSIDGVGIRVVPVAFGGYGDLPDPAPMMATLSITPHEGELVEIVRTGEVEVGEGMLRLQVLNEELIRGAGGQVRFVLENTGEEEIEITTARGFGDSASGEITFTLRDPDGNVLSSKDYRQSLGAGVVTLANGSTVARIDPGENFTSEPVELPVPLAAPDHVTVQLTVSRITFHQGREEQVVMDGLTSRHEVNLTDTSYSGKVTAVSPEISNGDQDIVISGLATDRTTGLPAARVPLKLVISLGGFERSNTVSTDGNGCFTFIFQPLPLECGRYSVFAVHPEVSDKPCQAQFVINRVTVTPGTLNVNIPKNYEKRIGVRVSTGDGTNVHNMHLVCEMADQPEGVYPEGVHVTVGSPISFLGSGQTASLTFSVWADNTAGSSARMLLKVKSDEKREDPWGTVTVNLQFSEAEPALFFTPNHVETGVSFGGIVSESITLENRGLADLAGVNLALVAQDGSPAPSWVHHNSTSNVGNIAVGDKHPVSLSFTPSDQETAEGFHHFALRVSSSNYRRTDIPLYVTVTQSGTGNALLKIADIYTGTVNARGEIVQGLSGASVAIQNEVVLNLQRTQSTDSLGEVLFRDLPAGRYRVRVTAPNHQEHTGRIWVKPGITASESIFLQYNLVTVEWEVVETSIQDKYEIVLTATFETNVPAPVVLAEPASVNLPDMKAGDIYFGELTLTNYGLVRADNVEFTIPDGGEFAEYELLTALPDRLNAKEKVVIPFRVTCLKSFNPAEDGAASGGGCQRKAYCGRVTYDYVCANGQRTDGESMYCVIINEGDCSGQPAVPGSPGQSAPGGEIVWSYSWTGVEGTVGSPPPTSPKPLEGVKCWPVAARVEELTGPKEQCRPETKQDVLEEVGSSVNCILREFNDEASDLSVKVPGGNASILRTFYGNQWHFEELRHNLTFILDSLGRNITSIDKGGVIYERLGSSSESPVFVHGTYTIGRTEEGYLWQDNHGNWRSFDETGILTAYGTANGVLMKLVYNGEDGRLEGLADRNDRQVIWYEYDGDGRIVAVRDLEDRRVEYRYMGGRLSEVRDVLGNSTIYTYDGSGRMVRKTDPLGHSRFMEYDRYGNISRVVDDAGDGRFFLFDYDEGKKEYYAQIQTSSGMIKEVWYDREGDTRRVDVNGNTVRRIVKEGRNLIVTDESGQVTRKEMDEWGNVTKIVYPDGATVLTEYDHTLNRPVKVTDERGVVTLYAYDDSGNLLLKTEGVGTDAERTTRFTYDSVGNVIRVTGGGDANTPEAEAVMDYDASGNLIAITEPEGARTLFSHDAMGNVLTRTDPRGKVSVFAYDAAGRMTSAVDPMGHRTEIVYDAVGNTIQVIDPEGKTRNYEYDGRNRLVKEVDTGGNVTLFHYNSDGKLTRRTDPEGKVLDYEYDSRGRLIGAIDGNGNVVRVEYADGLGCSTCRGTFDQPARIVYPTFVKEFQYDVRGRKVEEADIVSANERTVTRFQYDPAGNLIALTDRESRTTQYSYDALGRLVRVHDPLGNSVKYFYDDRDSLISLIDAAGNGMRFEYDRNNRLIREVRPMGQETVYAYDQLSRLIRQEDPKGQVALYCYDDAGRLDRIQTYASTEQVTPLKTVFFAYDRVGNLRGYDDGVTSGEYLYDDSYRKTLETVNYGPFQLSSATQWTRNGKKQSFTGPDGVSYAYTYDGNNQLSGIEIPGRGVITYNSYHWFRPAMVTLPGGTTREYAYDPLMRLKAIEVKDPARNLLMGSSYSYDGMDNIVSRQTEHGDYGYTYDELYRLVRANRPDHKSEDFTYDGVGNRLSADAVRGSWSYNGNNELLGFESTAFSYDRNGNAMEMTWGENVIRYVHNAEDQLERVETGAGSIVAEYGYDPFGRRLWKDVGGRRTFFFYADEGLIGEYDADGNEIRSYGYRPGSAWTTDPVFMKQGSDYFFYQNDHLGTPTMMTASNGRIVWSARYTAFGEAAVDPASTVANPLRLGGQYYDAETGLHYNYHRTYHPGLGRYLEADPIGAAGGLNLYPYELNPINSLDPLGLYGINLGGVAEGIAHAAAMTAVTAAAVGVAVAVLPAAVIAAVPCSVVTGGALIGSAMLGWTTGQVITGDRVEFAFSDWQFHVRTMCSEERSALAGEALFGWGTMGVGALLNPRVCFEAGTPVLTDRGLVHIEELEPGDRVLSFDDTTGQLTYQEVLRVFETPDQPLYRLLLSDDKGGEETFHATAGHPFHVRGTGWIRAAELLPGDEVFTSSGGWMRVSGGTWTDRRATVYNIEVDRTHTYFVGHMQVWVHNVCADPFHHLLPQRSDLAGEFAARGINVHKFTMQIPKGAHMQIHKGAPRGGVWNKAWENYFKENPDATAEDIYKFTGELIYRFQVPAGKVVSYRKK